MKYYILLLAFLVAIFILPELALAVPQTPPPPGLPEAPKQTPIDGGLGLLAAAGGAYALNKLRQKKRAE